VPVGYLIATGVMVAYVLFAVAPPRPRRPSPVHLSFWLGYPVIHSPARRAFRIGNVLATAGLVTANDPLLQPGFEDAGTSVTAVVSLWLGRVGCADVVTDGLRHRRRAAVHRPSRSRHACDCGGRAAVRQHLRKTSSNPIVYAELPGAQHAFDFFYSIRFDAVIDGIEVFVTRVLGR
jgi:hypothetical protein